MLYSLIKKVQSVILIQDTFRQIQRISTTRSVLCMVLGKNSVLVHGTGFANKEAKNASHDTGPANHRARRGMDMRKGGDSCFSAVALAMTGRL